MSDDPTLGDDETDDDTRAVVAFPDPPVSDCPIAFLGHHGEYLVFAMPEGAIRTEKASDIARKIKLDIFNRREGQQFLNWWRDADDKFQRDLAALWFIRKCREAPFWDASRPQRGLGVWPGLEGDVILHRGHELWSYGNSGLEVTSVAEALRRPGPIYALKAVTPCPAEEPSTAAEGRWLRETLDAWNWEQVGDEGLTGADVIAGWLMASLLGAVPPFRPHVLLYAMFGSGKTTLVNFVHAALSALAGDVLDSFTKAGLANDLGGMARPVIIDEAEAQASAFNGVGPVEEALELIRRMATGVGAVRKMGTIGGGSVTQTAVGSVLMAAVNPVKLGPADASRIAEAKLLPLDMPRAPGSAYRTRTDAQIKEAIATAKALAPALLSRALNGSERYLADMTALKAAFMARGEAPRAADLVAAIAAGRRMLTHDEALSEADAAEEASFWQGMLNARQDAEMVSNPGRDCLAHLMGWPSGQHRHDRIATLGELVNLWDRATTAGSSEDIADIESVMREHGLRLDRFPAGGKGSPPGSPIMPFLMVAHHAPGLDRIFERTVWRDWRRTLAYLDALGPEHTTRVSTNPVRFGVGVVQRATVIPLTPWLAGFMGARGA